MNKPKEVKAKVLSRPYPKTEKNEKLLKVYLNKKKD
jgi:hypothetical protein